MLIQNISDAKYHFQKPIGWVSAGETIDIPEVLARNVLEGYPRAFKEIKKPKEIREILVSNESSKPVEEKISEEVKPVEDIDVESKKQRGRPPKITE